MAGNLNSGPPPKSDAERRRRNAVPAAIKLPAEGRRGPAPKFPLTRSASSNAARRETAAWRDLWKSPQAVAWERLGAHRLVARYVRLLVHAEAGNVQIAAEVRQLEDRLGLNPLAMMRLRWEISTDEVGERREARQSTARKRLRAVDPDAVRAVDAGAVAGA